MVDPWQYIETDMDPCAGPVVEKGDETFSDLSFAKLYPNPVKEMLSLICTDCIVSNLYSIDGRKLWLNLVEQASGRYQFATNHLPDGMYFLQVTNGKGDIEAFRFVVQH